MCVCVGGSYFSTEKQSVYSTVQADRAIVCVCIRVCECAMKKANVCFFYTQPEIYVTFQVGMHPYRMTWKMSNCNILA